MNNWLKHIQTRRSLRRYTNESVPETILRDILTAGHWAPSAHNRQPWRFAIIQSNDNKVRLAQAMGERLRHDLITDNVPNATIDADVTRSYDRLTQAPILILICLSLVDMDVYTDANRNQHEYVMAVQSVAMAGQNIMLMAHAHGLATCWMCAPLFCAEVVIDTLELPSDWQPMGVIALGYPDQTREKTRTPIETRLIWR